MQKLEDRPWWSELVQLKDDLSLRELSERYGAAPAAISNALKRAGYSRVAAPSGPRANRDPAMVEAAQARLRQVAGFVDGGVSSVSAPDRTERAVPKAADAKNADPTKADAKKADAKRAGAKKAEGKKAEGKKAGAKKAEGKKAEAAAKAQAAAAEAAAKAQAEAAEAKAQAEAAEAKAQAEAAEAEAAEAKAQGEAAVASGAVGGSRVSPRKGTSRLEAFRDLLGKLIDREIADRAGVSISAVTNFRQRHGIPAATQGGRPSAPPRAAARQAAPKVAVAPPVPVAQPVVADADRTSVAAAGGDVDPATSSTDAVAVRGFGYRVVIDGQGYVVVAADIVDAARIALRSAQGAVTEISLLGSAIG